MPPWIWNFLKTISKMITPKILHSFLEKCLNKPPNLRECKYIIDKIASDSVSQVIFDFGENSIGCILKAYEKQEEYERCADIVKAVKIHRKVNNVEIKI